MKTKKQIDKEYEDILWSKVPKDYPNIVVFNLVHPIQEMFDFAVHDLKQETIYKAIIIEYHNRFNELCNKNVQAELHKKIEIPVIKESSWKLISNI